MNREQIIIRVLPRQISLSFRGKTHLLAKSKGWNYLLQILSRPGIGHHPQELLYPAKEVQASGHSLSKLGQAALVKKGLYPAYLDSPIPLSDEQSISEVKARLLKLINLEAEMRVNCDYGRLEDILDEKEKLIGYLKESYHSTGKIRCEQNSALRAKNSVNKAIKRVIEDISSADTELGAYFNRCIRRGATIFYQPAEFEVIL